MSGPRWEAVLDEQLDLHRFWRTDYGRRSALGFGESMMRVETEEHPGTEDHVAELVGVLDEAEALKLYLADTFYVAPEMMSLVEKAAETFQAEPLRATDLISQHGFVVLPRPLPMKDRNGNVLSFRAFAWMPVLERATDEEGMFNSTGPQTGIHISLYTHIDDAADPAADYFAAEHTLEEIARVQDLHRRMGTPYTLAHFTIWPFGLGFPEGMEGENASAWWTPVQAFFRLTLQTIGDRYQQRPPRAARKRADRILAPREDRYVTVIRLRRPRAKRDGEPAPVDWQHRWLVGGHWRNQWYAGIGEHRQIWISPYVKGPEDKPLLLRQGRAFELVR